MNETLEYARMPSPLGELLLAGDAMGLRAIELPGPGQAQALRAGWRPGTRFVAEAMRQLEEWLAGKREDFELALAPPGTAFQQRVWQELRRIPFGATISYGELARRIGSPGASRAVGAANGANPIPIVIPCHRVIAADGSLGGYSGGLDFKRWLLAHERRRQPLLA